VNGADPTLLAVLTFVLLLAMGGAVAALRVDARSRARTERFGQVLRPLKTGGAAFLREAEAQAGPGDGSGLGRRIAAILGFDPTQTDQHPAPWPALLLFVGIVSASAGWYGALMLDAPRLGLVFGPAGFVLLSRMLFETGRQRYRERLYAQFPDALASIVRAVRAGIPVTEAMRLVARDALVPTSTQFERMCGELAVGKTLEDALWAMARRTGLPDYAFFAVALTLQGQTGGNLTDTLENLADVVRKRVALKARALALAAEARTSAAVLIAVPVIAGSALMLLNPDYIGLLIHERRGRLVLGGAVLMLTLGILSMRTIIRRSLT